MESNDASNSSKSQVNDQIVVALRQIVRAIDLHSKQLRQEFGLTGPQIVLLRELVRRGQMHTAELAKNISLSHATVTDILSRLERRGFVSRKRSELDRRRVIARATEHAVTLVSQSPPLLDERFSLRLERLLDWERAQVLYVLQRVAWMMDASQIDASPLLTTGPVTEAQAVSATSIALKKLADTSNEGTLNTLGHTHD